MNKLLFISLSLICLCGCVTNTTIAPQKPTATIPAITTIPTTVRTPTPPPTPTPTPTSPLTTTTTPPYAVINATDTEKKEFLKIIQDAKDKLSINAWEKTALHYWPDEDKIADKTNTLFNDYLTGPRDHLIPWPESYCGSIYVEEGVSQINSAIAERWLNNPRALQRLTYPGISAVGLSIKAYPGYVICVFIYDKSYIRDQDKRYIQLLPIYYEITHSIYDFSFYPSIDVN